MRLCFKHQVNKIFRWALGMGNLPDGHHVVVHLLQLLLGGVQGVGWWIELVGLERLVGEVDGEGLIIFLQCNHYQQPIFFPIESLNERNIPPGQHLCRREHSRRLWSQISLPKQLLRKNCFSEELYGLFSMPARTLLWCVGGGKE
jgi:hypothetical protein